MKKIVSLFCGLLLLSGSCDYRDIDYTYYDGVSVTISLDWAGINPVPELVKAVFYPVNGGKPEERLIEPAGETVYLPIGTYNVVIYNWDTRTIRFRGDTYETLEAYTDESVRSSDFSKTGTGPVIAAPDKLYAWSLQDFEVSPAQTKMTGTKAETGTTLQAKPVSLVSSHDFFIPVDHTEYAFNVDAVITGMSCSILLHSQELVCTNPASVVQTVEKNNKGFACSYSTFGYVPEVEHHIILNIQKPDGIIQTQQYNVTEQINNEQPVEITEEIKIEFEPQNGGFEPPSVGGWEDENIDIPL